MSSCTRSFQIAIAFLLMSATIAPRSAFSDPVLADRQPLEVPGCNATTWWQIPNQKDTFVGRVLRDADLKTPCPTNDAWALVWGKMDWAGNRIVSKGRIFNLPLEINNGAGKFTITTAYDPSVMIYKGEHWLAFECYGPGFLGSVATCMSPLDLERGVDTSRLYIAVEGVSQDKNDEAHVSASAPKLLSYEDRAYLYWTSVRIRKSDNAWLGLTVRGVELVSMPTNKLVVPKGFGPRMPSNHPLAVEVMGSEPGGRQADAYEIRKIGSDFYLFGSSSNCLVPVSPTPGCYQLTIRKSHEALGQHIFNEARVSSTALPPNPVQYMHLVETPKNQLRLIGQILPLESNARAEPAGYFSYAINLGASDAFLGSAGASKQATDFVERAYRVLLDREADPSGLHSQTAALRDGVDKQSILAGLLLSPEARGKFHWEQMSNADFVQFLYQRLLGRAAEPDGFRMWTDEIKTGRLTREVAIKRFLATKEFTIRHPELQ